MSGYFARIARQSGARFPGGGERHHHAGKSRADRNLLPIDREETVMISPKEGVETSMSRPVVKDVADASPKARRRHTSGEGGPPLIDSKTKTASTDVASNVPPVHVAEDSARVEPDVTGSPNFVFESPSMEARKNEADTAKQDPASLTMDARVIEAVAPEPIEKKFFKKISGLIEGKAAKPSEVHSILFQEVQEWIAAGQDVAAEVRIDAPATAVTALPKKLPIESERPPGVVRIMDGRRSKDVSDAFQESSGPPTSINEQNFELSIGSISVVVEGDNRLAPPPVNAAPQTAARETPRRTSRLSRHYL